MSRSAFPEPKFIPLAFERLPDNEQLRRAETFYALMQRRRTVREREQIVRSQSPCAKRKGLSVLAHALRAVGCPALPGRTQLQNRYIDDLLQSTVRTVLA